MRRNQPRSDHTRDKRKTSPLERQSRLLAYHCGDACSFEFSLLVLAMIRRGQGVFAVRGNTSLPRVLRRPPFLQLGVQSRTPETNRHENPASRTPSSCLALPRGRRRCFELSAMRSVESCVRFESRTWALLRRCLLLQMAPNAFLGTIRNQPGSFEQRVSLLKTQTSRLRNRQEHVDER